MKEPTYIAGTLRRNFIDIPAHIPDHAWIYERDTRNLSRNSYAEGRITSVMNFPTFPPEKFHYYREHGTARLLVSRNRREGRYYGYINGHYRARLEDMSSMDVSAFYKKRKKNPYAGKVEHACKLFVDGVHIADVVSHNV